jgi:hypothetical protein
MVRDGSIHAFAAGLFLASGSALPDSADQSADQDLPLFLLSVEANLPCALTVDGSQLAEYTGERPVRLRLSPGLHEIECTTEEGLSSVRTLTARDNSARQVYFDLVYPGRFVKSGARILDPIWNLSWQARSSREALSAPAADDYCTTGWRRPTASELDSLVTQNESVSASCGETRCPIHPMFEFAGFRIWSERKGIFDLSAGQYHPASSLGDDENAFAICVSSLLLSNLTD